MLPTGTSYWVNYVLRSVKVSGFTQKVWAAKLLSAWQLMDVLSSLKLLNALTALTIYCCFPYLCYLHLKGIFLDQVCSGVETESPVSFNTWTCTASNAFSAFLTLPFLTASSSLVEQAQAENQRSGLHLFLQQVSCCHVFTSNNLENFRNVLYFRLTRMFQSKIQL